MDSLLTVISAASDYDLVSLEATKSELNITDNSELINNRLKSLIHQTSALISNICDQVFALETVSEVFRLGSGVRNRNRGYGYLVEALQESLILRRRPIDSISSIVEDEITLATTDYEFDKGAGLVYRLTTDDFRCGWRGNKITVEYISGYSLPDDLPYDLQRACLLWIKSNYKLASRDSSVRSENVPGLMDVSYWDLSKISDVPPPEVSLWLSNYIETAIR